MWTFKLRRSSFSDGRPVTAGDFVFAFDRIAKKKNASELAYLLDEVQGFSKVNHKGKSAHMSGLSAPTKRRLKIELTRPDANFPTTMTHPALVPLESAAVKHLDRFLRRPVGNGPYRMAATWMPGGPVQLKANKTYRHPPAIDGIRFVVYPSASASWADLVNGDIDVSEVPVDQISDAAHDYGTRGYSPFLAASYYAFNLHKKQFRNKKLRTAVSEAIDRDAILKNIYGGSLVTPRGVVPKGMPGFSDDVCGKVCGYHPKRARHVVAKLSRKERTIPLETNSGQPYDRVNKAIAADLDKVGFKVKVRSYRFGRYLDLIKANRQHLYRVSWLAEYPDPDAFLYDLFSSRSPNDQSGFSNKKVDSLVAKAMRTTRKRKRLGLYHHAEDTIMHALPVVPIGSFVTHWAVQPWVHEISFDDTGGFDVARATIEDH